MATVSGKNSRGGIAKTGKNSGTTKTSNQNYATSLASGGSVTVKDGVKTYSDKSLQVKGKGGISISGKDYSVNKGGSGFAPTTSVITADKMKPVPPIPLATPAPIDGMFGITNAANAGLAALNGGTYDTKTNQIVPPAAAPSAPADNNQAILNSYLQANAGLEAPSSVNNLKEMQKMLRPKENLVNSLSGQLNTLNASRDAEMLKLEGQGRGQTQGFIGGEQARINREAAIQAMPIQAQLAIAQDDLDSARTYASQYFQAKMQDETNVYNQKKENNRLIFDYLTSAEQRRLDANEKALDREYNEKQATAKSAEAIALQAIEYGQSSLASKVMGLDPKSATYAQDVRNAMAGLKKPVAAVTAKAPDLQNFGTATAPLWKQYNPTTGEWEDVVGVSNTPTSNALGNALASQDIYNINNILNSKGLDSAVGPTGLARTEGGLWSATKRFIGGALAGGAAGAATGAPFAGIGAIPGAVIGALTVGTVRALQGTKDELTGDRANFIGSVEQMVAGLTTDKLAQAKGQGITFGALSDGERQMIAEAASKIGTWRQREGGKVDGEVIGYKVNENDFKKEVDTINYFKQLDAYLQGASPEEIGAQVMPDNTVWVMDSFGNMRQLISNQ